MQHLRLKTKVTVSALFLLLGLVGICSDYGPARTKAAGGGAPPPWPVPRGLPAALWRSLIPRDNPLTAEKVALGRALYFEKRLSVDRTLSCATCHDPAAAFADHEVVAVGAGERAGTRNVPTLLNVAFSRRLFWDGRASTLEEQALQPLLNPSEMGMPDAAAVVARLSGLHEYRDLFRRAFGTDLITPEAIAKALAAFERTQLSGNAPFDRFLEGEDEAITDAQKRGWQLFRHKAQCIQCHVHSPSAPFFTDSRFHNTGVAARGFDLFQLVRSSPLKQSRPTKQQPAGGRLAHTQGFAELGRYLVTGRPEDVGAFKTPSLRDVELTAPYMHNGSVRTLLDVVRFYNRGGEPNAQLAAGMLPLNLTEQEMSDLVEFLRALTSDDIVRQSQLTTPQTRRPSAGLNLP